MPHLAPASRAVTRRRAARLAIAALAGALALASAAACARRGAPAPHRLTSSLGTRSAADTLDQQAAVRVADAVCDRRLVLLGELPEHGHARGFGVKARVVEQLVARCGFDAVLFEAGSYDFFGLERAIAASRGTPRDAVATDSLELSLARAIGGLWWTRELGAWRRWLVNEAVAGRLAIGGMDDQPGFTAAWAKATLPAMVGAALHAERADECREAIARYMRWGYGPAQRYDSTERARLADCTRLAADRAIAPGTSPERRTPDAVMLADIASYYARERASHERRDAGPAERDLVMAQHVAWWSARLPADARIVVWTATVHAARERGDSARPSAPTTAQRLAERWGDRMATVGFTALRGEGGWARQPAKPLASLPPDALEARALAPGAAADTAAWAWLDRASLRALGPAPSRLLGEVTTADWSRAFDGVLVIRDEHMPAFEPRR